MRTGWRLLGAEFHRYLAECRAYWPAFVTQTVTTVIIFAVFFGLSSSAREPSAWFGYLLWILASSVLSEGPVSTNSEKQWGTLSQLLIRPIRLGSLLAIKTVVWTVVNLVFATVTIGLLALIFRLPLAWNWHLIPLGLLGLASLFGFTLVLTSLTLIWSKSSGLAGIVSYALLFLTGTLVPLESLPHFLRIIGYSLPLTGAITSGKEILTGGTIGWDAFALMLAEGIGYIGLGILIFQIFLHRAKRQGISMRY